MKDLKTATIEGVTDLIGKAAESLGGAQAPPAMLAAYDAIIKMIEQKSRSDATHEAMNKVRAAVGLPIPTKENNV